MNNNSKIGIFYSLFCDDDISKSIRYIIRVCQNIKIYNQNNLLEQGIYIIINLDNFTYDVILSICKQEVIDTSNIIFKIWNRNTDLRGMIWRFESFTNLDYDITINAEADWDILRYFQDLIYFINKPEREMYIHNVRRFDINENWIAAGTVFIRPRLLSNKQREIMSLIISEIDNFDYIHYGIDEKCLSMYIKKLFTNDKLLFKVNNRLKIFQHVEDVNSAIKQLKILFVNSLVYSISEIEYVQKKQKNIYKISNKNDSLVFLNKNDNVYILEDKKISFKEPNRVEIKPDKEKDILDKVSNIITHNK